MYIIFFQISRRFYAQVHNITFSLPPPLLQDAEKRTPMHAASYCGETECVAALIQAGESVCVSLCVCAHVCVSIPKSRDLALRVTNPPNLSLLHDN